MIRKERPFRCKTRFTQDGWCELRNELFYTPSEGETPDVRIRGPPDDKTGEETDDAIATGDRVVGARDD